MTISISVAVVALICLIISVVMGVIRDEWRTSALLWAVWAIAVMIILSRFVGVGA